MDCGETQELWPKWGAHVKMGLNEDRKSSELGTEKWGGQLFRPDGIGSQDTATFSKSFQSAVEKRGVSVSAGLSFCHHQGRSSLSSQGHCWFCRQAPCVSSFLILERSYAFPPRKGKWFPQLSQ